MMRIGPGCVGAGSARAYLLLAQSPAQLLERPTLDLAHPLFRNAEPGAQGFERRGSIGELAMTHDHAFARIEPAQRRRKLCDAPIGIDRCFGKRVGQRPFVGEKLEPLHRRGGIGGRQASIERKIAARKTRVHQFDIGARHAERFGDLVEDGCRRMFEGQLCPQTTQIEEQALLRRTRATAYD